MKKLIEIFPYLSFEEYKNGSIFASKQIKPVTEIRHGNTYTFGLINLFIGFMYEGTDKAFVYATLSQKTLFKKYRARKYNAYDIEYKKQFFSAKNLDELIDKLRTAHSDYVGLK